MLNDSEDSESGLRVSQSPEIIIRTAETMLAKERLNSVVEELKHPVEEALSRLVAEEDH